MESNKPQGKLSFWGKGEAQVWLTGGMLSMTLLMTLTLVVVVCLNGLGYFWPKNLVEVTLEDGSVKMGELVRHDEAEEGNPERSLFKIGNRDLYGLDFGWINNAKIKSSREPAGAVALEREEYGNFYGFLKSINAPLAGDEATGDMWERFNAAHETVEAQLDEIAGVKKKMMHLNNTRNRINLRIKSLEYNNPGGEREKIAQLEHEADSIGQEFEKLNADVTARLTELKKNVIEMADASGVTKTVPITQIVRAYRPNSMGPGAKIAFYISRIWELLFAQPREANTEGGLFPAIFGTVLMVFMMSLFCVPMGVIAAIYLREYAREGMLVAIVRIAVNNLAGVPSIVFGVFGLGFFVYGVGGVIDRTFFPERLPSSTFGTGGILWASLTMALLTVPVVIVSTEEALAAIPRGIREGSLALGATQQQTLTRILLPMASPGIMTGLVLAMARAAGEVAPLMIVGVVKLAPALVLDGEYPFLHLDRKFMHLGFHIFDMGFQSPNAEAAKPMVFVSTLLLLLIVIAMTGGAIHIRNRMRKKLAGSAF